MNQQLIQQLIDQLKGLTEILLSMLIVLAGMTGQLSEPKELSFGSATFETVTLTDEAEILSAVSTLQDDYFLKNGDYFTELNKIDTELSKINADRKIETIRYKHLGSLGYYTILEWEKGGYRHIKSTGYGVLAQQKSWEYQTLLGTASTTP